MMMMWAHHNQRHHSAEVDRAGHERCPMTEAYRLHTGLGPWRLPLGSNPRHRCAGRTKLWEATQGICVFSAGRAGQLSLEEEAQLTAMCVASQPAAPGGGASEPVAPGGGASQPVAPIESRRRPRFETLMEAIREFGRLPKESRTASKKERSLAMRLRDAKRGGNLSDEHKAELAAMSAKELGSLEEVDLPPDHTDRFADMAGNRLEQDLLMVMNGTNRKKVLQRMIRYKKYLTHPGACIVIVEKYKDKVFQALLGHRLAMSAASQPAPPGATKSRASRSCASLPPPRKAKRSRHAVGGA